MKRRKPEKARYHKKAHAINEINDKRRVCGKAFFKNKKNALTYKDECMKKGKVNRGCEVELNVYKCPMCKRWHLTSQTKGE